MTGATAVFAGRRVRKAEQVLDALKTLLQTVSDAVVERNSVLPEKIPDGGLVLLRDGDPGEPEQALGGFGSTYYQHAVEIEIYVEQGNAAIRDIVFDDLLQQIGAALDVINDEGDIVVPVDPRYLGLWLTGVFGDPDTTDNLDGSWDHEFASGADDLPSYTVEVGMPKVPAFFPHAGVKLNSIALEFTRSGPAVATINAIAQGETGFGTSQGGTPTSLTYSRISQFQGSIKRAGNPVGNLTGGSVTYSNNLEKIETIRDDGLIEGADPTIAALTGRIDVRFAEVLELFFEMVQRRVR
jgi:Phage tail tube protein